MITLAVIIIIIIIIITTITLRQPPFRCYKDINYVLSLSANPAIRQQPVFLAVSSGSASLRSSNVSFYYVTSATDKTTK